MATPTHSEHVSRLDPRAARRRELLELEHAFWNAMQVRDGRTATRLNDTTTIVVGPQGIGELPRANVAELVENAAWKLERFDIDPEKVIFKMIDVDVAVVAYEVEETRSVAGSSTTIRAFDTSVWVRKLNRWVCAMHTETLAGDRSSH